MSHFKKGMEVHARDYNGRIDERTRYLIRSCGKKQAILDRITQADDGEWVISGYRGRSFYLDTEARVRRAEEQGLDTSRYKTSWNQMFVMAGEKFEGREKQRVITCLYVLLSCLYLGWFACLVVRVAHMPLVIACLVCLYLPGVFFAVLVVTTRPSIGQLAAPQIKVLE